MFLIYSGWGGIAIVIPFLLIIACLFLGQYWRAQPGEGDTKICVVIAIALAISAVPLWLFGRRVNRLGNGEYSTDHSLYSIPLQYWGVIWAIVSVGLITWRLVR